LQNDSYTSISAKTRTAECVRLRRMRCAAENSWKFSLRLTRLAP